MAPLSTEQEDWICLSRPTIMDGPVVAWRPAGWASDDRGYAVSVSRAGVLIGEVYLHQIPDWVLEDAKKAHALLQEGQLAPVVAMVTHRRFRRGAKWYLEPLDKVAVET